MRIALLLQGMSAYLDASFRELGALGHELLLVFPEAMKDAPYDNRSFGTYATCETWSGEQAPDTVPDRLVRFDPDAVIMAGWHGSAYRESVARLRGRALRVLFMDNVWNNDTKQWLGRLTHRRYLSPLFDAAFVPGDRQEWFARRLGFASDDIIRGGYAADVASFDRGERDATALASCHAFLFAGRLVPAKGVATLAAAYRGYRSVTPDPWPLHVAGTGECAALLEGIDGVQLHGFRQPAELIDLMHGSACLLFPSLDEHYGLLVHEAAAAGMTVLCSDVAGVVPMMMQDNHNGWVLPAGVAQRWTDAMVRVSASSDEELARLSRNARQMAARIDSTGWARNLSAELNRLCLREGITPRGTR